MEMREIVLRMMVFFPHVKRKKRPLSSFPLGILLLQTWGCHINLWPGEAALRPMEKSTQNLHQRVPLKPGLLLLKQNFYRHTDLRPETGCIFCSRHREKTTHFLFLDSGSHHSTWKAQGLSYLAMQLFKKWLETSRLSPANLQGLGSSLVKWGFFKDRKEEQWWVLGV